MGHVRTSTVFVSVMVLLHALLVIGLAPPAEAAVRTYPGPDGCNNTLQQCINRVPDNSTIRIDTNQTIEENIQIDKSLTLKAAAGRSPVLDGRADWGIDVNDGGRVQSDIVIEGITIRSNMRVHFDEGFGHTFTLRDSRVIHSVKSDTTIGILLDYDVHAIATLRNNVVRSNGRAISFRSKLAVDNAPAFVVAVGNYITSPNPLESRSGIEILPQGAEHLRAYVHSNVIHDVAGCACTGNRGGLVVRSANAKSTFVGVVNNTIDLVRGGAGVVVTNEAPTTFHGHYFNNIVTRVDGPGFDAGGPTSHSQHSADDNDTFENAAPDNFGGWGSGPGMVQVRPQFVNRDQNNFRLKPTSPLLDKGRVCSAAGLFEWDASGNARFTRYSGGSVDMGAYEFSSTDPLSGRVFNGTDGEDDLTGTPNDDLMCGYADQDNIAGRGGDDYIDAGTGNDEVHGGGNSDVIYGGPFEDTLTGGEGADYLYGGPADDLLRADDGVGSNDYASGGDAFDTCFIDEGDSMVECEIGGVP